MSNDAPCRVSADLRDYQARQADMTASDEAELADIRTELAVAELADHRSLTDAMDGWPEPKLVALVCESPAIVTALLRQVGLGDLDNLPQLVAQSPLLRSAILEEIAGWERIGNAADHEFADLIESRRAFRGHPE